jgi:hypothetical protein
VVLPYLGNNSLDNFLEFASVCHGQFGASAAGSGFLALHPRFKLLVNLDYMVTWPVFSGHVRTCSTAESRLFGIYRKPARHRYVKTVSSEGGLPSKITFLSSTPGMKIVASEEE